MNGIRITAHLALVYVWSLAVNGAMKGEGITPTGHQVVYQRGHHMTATMDTPLTELTEVLPAPTPAELLEAAWLWSDALDGCGDDRTRHPADWSSLSATHGGTWSP
jgi:hypothetical protein